MQDEMKILMELGGLIIEPQGKMKVNDWIEASNQVFIEGSEIENKYKDLLEEIGKLRAELDTLNSQLQEVEPFKNIGIDLKVLYSSTNFEVALVVINEIQKKQLEDKGAVVIVEELGNNKYASLVLSRKGSNLDEILKELGLRKFETPDFIAPQIYYSNLKERINNIQTILTQRREELAKKSNIYYLGRGLSLPLAMEGALKIKEIAYVHAEAYPAGESKHGPISLVEKGFPVVIINDGELTELLQNNLMEMKARGARIYAVSVNKKMKDADVEIELQSEIPVLSIAPVIQLIAYYAAVTKGYDPDKPRNLAKTVTVE